MTKLKIFKKNYEGTLEEKFNKWTGENPGFTISHMTASDSSSQHGSRNQILYVIYETNDKVTL